MYTKEEIDKLIELNKLGDNFLEQKREWPTSLKLKILETKVLVDRWSYVATNIIIHLSHKDYIQKSFKDYNAGFSLGNPDTLWGADIHYVDTCPKDIGIITTDMDIVDSKDINLGRWVAIFPMP